MNYCYQCGAFYNPFTLHTCYSVVVWGQPQPVYYHPWLPAPAFASDPKVPYLENRILYLERRVQELERQAQAKP